MGTSEKEIEQRLRLLNAIITGSHVVYTAGKHGGVYVNKDGLYPHPLQTAFMARQIAKRFLTEQIDVVIAPGVGAIILGQWVAYFLIKLTYRQILSVYAEKEVVNIDDPSGGKRKCFAETGEFTFNRGYGELIKGKRGLVVEDIVNSGGSARKVVEAARLHGCEVIGVGVLCNRGQVTVEKLGNVPRLEALVNATLDAWEPADCPLCAGGVPINTTVGKGRAFLDNHPEYPRPTP